MPGERGTAAPAARVHPFPFRDDVGAPLDRRFSDWPVVYTLNGTDEVYVGESLNVVARMRQHRDDGAKDGLGTARVVVDDTFNKSACLDLESYLIRLFAGDGKYRVLNRNEGVTDADYYERARYRASFAAIVEELRTLGLFEHTVPEIENSDLFKLSPFKALTDDQAIVIESILDALFGDLASGAPSTTVVQGDPGTGKTIVAIYLLKMLSDIALADLDADVVPDSVFAEHFTADNRDVLRGARIGMVVPQLSLRASISRVFARTPGLERVEVLTPFEVGAAAGTFDLLLVDETHRLNHRASQATGVLNAKFASINRELFGADDLARTQLDWIVAKSRHRVFLVDSGQRVRPADLPTRVLDRLVSDADADGRYYRLSSQLRVAAGADYVAYIRDLLAPVHRPELARRAFPGYDLRHFEDMAAMRTALDAAEREHGLARLVAGFAWRWRSRRDKTAVDFEIDGVELRWNSTDKDWIASPGAAHEVGSIHTVQGYDLNYTGVIIGPELRYDPSRRRLVLDRAHYADRRGKQNNRLRGITYSDDEILELVCNVYGVLMTRGMRGTFVYACDPELRRLLAATLPRG
ncbi:DUF2075 domain-containing protein [Cellulomonas triticagri]|uniref:DUF2075 domain-containing protein n=1 Tax=Cellulomonas triticagri TaxID=2483352 RepID=A0A3M2JI05_9CELL|nr:DUF2075 domain-containing protein [Cellulomonas triticagri]RMI12704.1 DUF2075 domain-containing protein [Cellulomonas triticagri]